MSLNENYWEKHLEDLKGRIPEAINNSKIGTELEEELLGLYSILDDRSLPLEWRKQKAILVEHFLRMCDTTSENNPRKR